MPSLSLKPSGRRNLRLRCYTEVGWREFSTVLYSMCVSDGAVLCSALLYTTVPSTDTTAVGLTWCSQDGPGGGVRCLRARKIRPGDGASGKREGRSLGDRPHQFLKLRRQGWGWSETTTQDRESGAIALSECPESGVIGNIGTEVEGPPSPDWMGVFRKVLLMGSV